MGTIYAYSNIELTNNLEICNYSKYNITYKIWENSVELYFENTNRGINISLEGKVLVAIDFDVLDINHNIDTLVQVTTGKTMDGQYIGISEHRIKHMIGVARKCYQLAKEKYNMSEEDARKYFVMGILHDIGYEFTDERSEHPFVGADILDSFTIQDITNINNAIRHHGKCLQYEYTKADYILNEADLTIDSKGNKVSMEQRCNDIKERYGEDSRQYKNAKEMKRILENDKKL